MVKIGSKEINQWGYGFKRDDAILPNTCVYDLLSSPTLLVGKDGKRLKADIITASTNYERDHEKFFEILDFTQSVGLEVIVAVDNQFGGELSSPAERKLAEKLKQYNGIIKRGFNAFFDGIFDEPEYVLMLAQCSSPENFNSFLERCLRVSVRLAEESIKEGTEPNYRVDTHRLLEDMSEYTGRKLELKGIPEIIAGYHERKGGLSKLVENAKYVRAIVQENGSSFTHSPAMQKKVSKVTEGLEDDLEKCAAIFGWVTSNIKYGKEKRKPGVAYRGALQVYQDKEGVCGESAALQVTMERLAGNIAFLVEVDKDHACAAHIRQNGEVVLLDTVNKDGFNARYDDFKIISDDHSLAKYV